MKGRGLIAVQVLALLVILSPLARAQKTKNGDNDTLKDPGNAQGQVSPDAQNDGSTHVSLRPGTKISIRIADELNTSHDHAGDLLTGTVDPSVLIDNHVVIPRGTEAHVRVVEDKKGGHLHGKADVRLELISLVMNKQQLNVYSSDYTKQQGALSAKLKGTENASASSGASAATSPTPEGGAVGPIIAVFRAAKIDLHGGTRIPFTLTTEFSFDAPGDTTAQR